MTDILRARPAVAAGLQARLEKIGQPARSIVSIEPFGDGHSGVTYLVRLESHRDVERAVLRLSPPGARLVGPADVGRQGRIMQALAGAGAPVPRVIDCDSGPAIDGRAFALTEYVAGSPWEDVAETHADRFVARAAIHALHQIQRVGLHDTGIGSEPATTPRAEVERWAGLLARTRAGFQVSAEPLSRRLLTTAPEPTSAVLVHGDYHYGNLIFAEDRVVAVVDWEIAQLGEPLFDVGCLAVASLRRRYPSEPNPTGGVDVSLRELAAIYDADPDSAAWFFGLSCFKYAVILAYNLELHRSGKRVDDIYEQLRGTASGLLTDGLALVQHGLDVAVEDAARGTVA